MLAALAGATLVIYLLLDRPVGLRSGPTQVQLLVAAETLSEQLVHADESTWNLIVERYLERFDFTVEWRSMDDPQLMDSERRTLAGGEPIVLETGQYEDCVLRLIPGTERILEVRPRRPLDDPKPTELLIAAAGALAVFGLSGFLLLIPVVRRLKALEAAAHSFGHGDWKARAPDRPADAIGRLATALNGMAARIEDLLREKNSLLQDQRELMQAVAHEFRGPMSRLTFALDMNLEAESEELRTELSSEIVETLAELDTLVSEVLRYTRLQPGAPLLNPEIIEVAAAIDDVVKQCRDIEPDIHLSVAPHEPTPLRIRADPQHFTRAVSNLVSNGVRHARAQVRIAWGSAGDGFWLTVEDDGLGITPHRRERIFEPFTRLDPSRARNSGGTGLGLAIVKRISQKHEGDVTADDSPLGGARFTLRWPVLTTAASSAVALTPGIAGTEQG